MKLTNQKVLITGGSSGIGRSLAKECLVRGNQVAICGRDRQKLNQARADLGDVAIFPCDLEDPIDVAELPDQVAEHLGGLSILVNNAGVQHNYSFADVDAAQISIDAAQEIQINLTSLIARWCTNRMWD